MNTVSKNSRVQSFPCFAVGLVVLLGALPSCYVDAKIGNDPESDSSRDDDDDHGHASDVTTDPTAGPGATSGQSGPATATVTSAGEDTGGGGLDPETALEVCGVVVVPPEPGQPLFQEGIECSGGCNIDVQSSQQVNLYDFGECLCAAMDCGQLGGGTTGSLPGDDTDTATGGEPDGCGPFPSGEGQFTCECEMCSIDVTNVDATWVEEEADLPSVCACMCGGAGCGSPT